jgi:hypothetical protein
MNTKIATLTLGLVAALVVLALAGASTSGAARPGFSARVDNPWFPLKPGTVYEYRGVRDGKPTRDVMTVTHAAKVVDGAECVVVRDLLYIDGRLAERTADWFAQDAKGNVWYFGEDTAELDRQGRVTTTEGSWESGRDGAKAGIFMPAHPRVGQAGRQEYYKGHAEDHFRVVSLRASVKVPYTSSKTALLIEERTPLEPGLVDHKLYVRGIGMVLEQTIKGGDERNALVSVKRT